MVDDVENAVKGSRIWKGASTIVDAVSHFMGRFVKPEKSRGDRGSLLINNPLTFKGLDQILASSFIEEESSDENKDVPEPHHGEATDDGKKRKRRRRFGQSLRVQSSHLNTSFLGDALYFCIALVR